MINNTNASPPPLRMPGTPWARAAEDLGEEHYRREFFDALDAAGRKGETALEIFGPVI